MSKPGANSLSFLQLPKVNSRQHAMLYMQSLFIIYIFSAMTQKRANGLDARLNLPSKNGQDGLPHATACPDWENAVYCLVSPVHTP
jgi:hypothetical protein